MNKKIALGILRMGMFIINRVLRKYNKTIQIFNSPPQTKSMNNVADSKFTALFLDRVNRKNLGARATGKALFQLCSEAGILITDTFDGDFASTVSKKLSIDKLASRILVSKDDNVRKVLHSLKLADMLILNGEGSMIFATPPRMELKLYFAMLKIANLFGKKTFYINSVASADRTNCINEDTLYEIKSLLRLCDRFVVRDELSYQFAKRHLTQDVIYIPDALFYWTKYIDQGLRRPELGDLVLSFPDSTFDYGKFDFTVPYIIISDSSGLGHLSKGPEIIDNYVKLIEKMKCLGLAVYLMETCGENFISDVGRKSNVPVISSTANLLMMISILAGAELFISGRYHPSIAASFGGTPCIMLDSNCHKSMAFLKYFDSIAEYPQKIFSCLLSSDDEIEEIYQTAQILLLKRPMRKEIRNKAKELALQNKKYMEILVSN